MAARGVAPAGPTARAATSDTLSAGPASMAVFETSKENVQPSRKGRDIRTLTAALAERVAVATPTRAYEARIASATDPEAALLAWRDYISWLESHIVTGGGVTLHSTLQRCVHALLPHACLHDDPRYVHLWVSLAHYCDSSSDARDVFKFMASRGVGAHASLFYIAAAFVAEKSGDWSTADALYKRGLESGAIPRDRLLARFKQFQHRMYKHFKSEEEGVKPPPDRLEPGGRDALTTLHRATLTAPTVSVAPVGNLNRRSTVLEAFDEVADSNPLPPAAAPPIDYLKHGLELRKENRATPSTWTAAALPVSTAARTTSTGPDFLVYEEPVPAAPVVAPVAVTVPVAVPVPVAVALDGEVSFEEARAVHWRRSHPVPVPTSTPRMKRVEVTAAVSDVKRLFDETVARVLTPPNAHAWDVPTLQRLPVPTTGSDVTGQFVPSPADFTLHTATALAVLRDVFTSPTPAPAPAPPVAAAGSSRPVPPGAKRLSMHVLRHASTRSAGVGGGDENAGTPPHAGGRSRTTGGVLADLTPPDTRRGATTSSVAPPVAACSSSVSTCSEWSGEEGHARWAATDFNIHRDVPDASGRGNLNSRAGADAVARSFGHGVTAAVPLPLVPGLAAPPPVAVAAPPPRQALGRAAPPRHIAPPPVAAPVARPAASFDIFEDTMH